MKIIKEFRDLPEDWKEQLFEKAQGTILPKRKVGSKIEPHKYPTPVESMYLSLFIDKATHEKFLEEVLEYKEAWEFALELCKAEWMQQATRLMNDRNVSYAATFDLVNYNFPGTFKMHKDGKQKAVSTSNTKQQYSDDDIKKLLEGQENSSGNADS